MSGILWAVAVLLGAATAGFAVAALASGYRAVRIGGAGLLFSGWQWIAASDRIPAEARPHMLTALRRWVYAGSCMVLAAFSGIAADLAR
ncbi:hypothetical protein [Neoroseomonas soli]|uniref:Uncharacterized protein n=1 Tax=Neoroseomonas soli TaxID=1081025 RepID=A0A9X9WXS3_9PROT|nr:hypothetical protein [Neoroseomonas soli]MBR0671952.1 hypothetical protein [Neoroseomonas soli]